MKITADTNLLLRALVPDDDAQQTLAMATLQAAELVAISAHCLCEFTWVLERSYGAARAEIAASIRRLMNTKNVALNRPAVEAGLAMMDAGGDFADGVIAYEGAWLGGETFVSFDKQAVKLLTAQGHAARTP
jgi:predicted nucleic-acid-binding protein